ncbi:30S ribosomal protein S8 [Patescibacteria group bacterium]|nr:30S ribosomal protein S8 [Patescibacteria group bacterium]MBU1673658.1 30S ribosomal protein S8 [Patescibacteria group bacterium]MBU1963854.1 30S ribosomal protein S8 [Patescibacteria group bacterium]
MTDPIADMLTRIRNAQAVKKSDVVVPYSKLKMNLANILVKEGYLGMSEIIDEGGKPVIKITIKYDPTGPVIKNLKRISKPGRRVYVGSKELPYVLNNIGIAVISTSHGLLTNKVAREKKLGGEVLCEIY